MNPSALTETDVLAFGRALSRLKQSGSTVLVTGSVPRAAFTAVSRQMLGDPGLSRRRLFVLTDATAESVDARLPVAADPGQTRIIEHCTFLRGATATANTTDGTHQYVYSDDLADLISATFEAIADLEVGAEPAELRVCIDSLTPLVEYHGRKATFAALHALCWRVRHARALGHAYLQTDDPTEVELYTELFDAHIELRDRAGTFQQRWHLRDENVTTDWLTLDAVEEG
ncbi:hypothetical protein ACFQH3_01190 [Haladaptatus sp. GCM10025707]|uniref:DUF7504 family protein n=1 Tax=unclassified Haladaptatus TaxID=2622732 RepID=UPI0023E7730C|nr:MULTISPECIES: hypothetical protein [unclassified Haladaptatus]